MVLLYAYINVGTLTRIVWGYGMNAKEKGLGIDPYGTHRLDERRDVSSVKSHRKYLSIHRCNHSTSQESQEKDMRSVKKCHTSFFSTLLSKEGASGLIS